MPGAPSPITAGRRQRRLPDPHRPQRPPRAARRAGAVGVVSWLLYRTTFGFEVRTVGANPDAARYAGMRPRTLIVVTMSICGALAGLAGTCDVLGIHHHVTSSFGTTVGFDSIAVALLGRSSPVGVLFAALLFGAMRAVRR